MPYATPESLPADIKVGVFMVAADQPVFTSMAHFHPCYSPQQDELGPLDEAATWFEAYNMHEEVAPAIAEARQSAKDDMDLEMRNAQEEGDKEMIEFLRNQACAEDYEPVLVVAGVSASGELYICDSEPLDPAKDAEVSPAEIFARSKDYLVFTREEVYASHGMGEPKGEEGLTP